MPAHACHASHSNVFERLKQEGKIAEAIKAMNSEILKDFVSDESSWEELAELCVSRHFRRARIHGFTCACRYVMLGHFKHAVFCMEEVFMSKPFYHTHCTKLAE